MGLPPRFMAGHSIGCQAWIWEDRGWPHFARRCSRCCRTTARRPRWRDACGGPDVGGPSVVAVRDGDLVDISASFPTMRDLCETDAPAERLRAATGERIGRLDDVLANTPPDGRDRNKPWLLAPIDLQAIKAAGVTFVVSMIERVIEERARGDLNAAAAIRAEVNRLVGDDLAKLKPGSAEASASEAGADRAGCVEPVSGGRHRSGRGDLHQGAADGRGRHRYGRGDSSEVVVEQPGTRGGAGRVIRPAASSPRRSATT